MTPLHLTALSPHTHATNDKPAVPALQTIQFKAMSAKVYRWCIGFHATFKTMNTSPMTHSELTALLHGFIRSMAVVLATTAAWMSHFAREIAF